MVYQILETAFKKETVGLVTREQYVEKVCSILFLFISLLTDTESIRYLFNVVLYVRGLIFRTRLKRKKRRSSKSFGKSEFTSAPPIAFPFLNNVLFGYVLGVCITL